MRLHGRVLDPGLSGVFECVGLLWLPATACDFKMQGTQLQAHIKHLPGVHLAPSLYQSPAFFWLNWG